MTVYFFFTVYYGSSIKSGYRISFAVVLLRAYAFCLLLWSWAAYAFNWLPPCCLLYFYSDCYKFRFGWLTASFWLLQWNHGHTSNLVSFFLLPRVSLVAILLREQSKERRAEKLLIFNKRSRSLLDHWRSICECNSNSNDRVFVKFYQQIGIFLTKYIKYYLHQIDQCQFPFWWEVHCDLFGKHLKSWKRWKTFIYDFSNHGCLFSNNQICTYQREVSVRYHTRTRTIREFTSWLHPRCMGKKAKQKIFLP